MNAHTRTAIGLVAATGTGVLIAVSCTSTHWSAADPLLPVADEIRVEATRPNDSEVGRPLPLAAHWDCLDTGAGKGFSPEYMLSLVEQGHYVLPGFPQPPAAKWIQDRWKPEQAAERDKWIADQLKQAEAPLKKAAKLRLPITFLATQWESTLTYDKDYLDLPPEKNPNVVGVDGKIQHRVSPFGPVEPWREVGRDWTSSRIMKQLQEWDPDPPRVFFISNNEHAKLDWPSVEEDRRYVERYGKGRDVDFKSKVVADGWFERYRALQAGFRDGLDNETWKKVGTYVGYNAVGINHYGRFSNWRAYALCVPGRIDSGPLTWDGGSPSYYVNDWDGSTDYRVWSPQVETMNWVFMVKQAHQLNPGFWFEMSTWDGNQPGSPKDKRTVYARQGQNFSPERYEGMIQFGMWMLRPRAVRDFRGWLEPVEYAGPYFMSVVNPVDRVHTNPVLREFWRKGELVPNRAHPHPYQTQVFEEYKNEDRWFLLDTSLDKPRPWPSLFTEIPVFSLALVKGTAPNRQWLVYAYSPLYARRDVQVTVPEFGPITVDAPQSGSFYLVSEKNKKVAPVWKGGPGSVQVKLESQFVELGTPVAFTTENAYSPNGKLSQFDWSFGDGTSGTGENVTHAFASRGQYLVTLKATDPARGETVQTCTVFAGLKPGDGLALRYLMTPPPEQGMLQWQWHGALSKPYYRFLQDSAGKSNLGFGTDGRWTNDSTRGPVMVLNGTNSHVWIPGSASVNVGGPYPNRTVLLWFNADNTAKRQVLYEEGNAVAGLNLYLEKGALHAGVWNTNVWAGTWLNADPIDAGKWYRAAVVLHDASGSAAPDKFDLYLNGQKSGSGNAAQLPQHTGDVNLGRSGDGTLYATGPDKNPGAYFAGRLGEFEIYNRALSEAEIQKDGR